MPSELKRVSQTGIRSTFVGILFSGVLVAIKGIAGIVGHSYALVADAIESATDIFTSLVVYSGLRIAALPPDEDHPYGHGKAEPLAATAVAIALYTAAAGIAIQCVREIHTPHHAPAPFTLPVLVLVVLAKEGLFRWVHRVGDSVDSTAVRADAWHHRSDALTSAAAFIGISIALVGGEGYQAADDWAALVASGIICYNATKLLKTSLAEIMDAAPPAEIEKGVREVALKVPGVLDLDTCMVRKMGLTFYVDLHVVVNGDLPVRDGHRIAHRVKDAIRSGNPRISDVLIHVEPDKFSD
ncbi:MAG: Ferrous-iron efflux pump FieF [bacterium]|nr:Ferrous-iron efflux pump FieF [bacterium]